jgi:hypothetical protein
MISEIVVRASGVKVKVKNPDFRFMPDRIEILNQDGLRVVDLHEDSTIELIVAR